MSPKLSAISNTASSSDETTILEKLSDKSAASIVQLTSGFPLKKFVFLPGNPFEPNRAGIIAILLFTMGQ
jgi:hypothetical protein